MIIFAVTLAALAVTSQARRRLLAGALLAWVVGSLLYSVVWYRVQLWLASTHRLAPPRWPWAPLGWLLLAGLVGCVVATGLGAGLARLRRRAAG
jgi:hypothetical protein